MELVSERGFTRLPVHAETIDKIVGAVQAKDLLLALAAGRGDERADATMRPVLYAPETSSNQTRSVVWFYCTPH